MNYIKVQFINLVPGLPSGISSLKLEKGPELTLLSNYISVVDSYSVVYSDSVVHSDYEVHSDSIVHLDSLVCSDSPVC